MWYVFIQQIIYGVPVGTNPFPDAMLVLVWILFGILFPIVSIFYFKLIIEVREDAMYIRFVPFHLRYRRFSFDEVQDLEFISYNAVKDFGGWGLRFNTKGEVLYNIGGNNGLKLRTKYETIMIGIQDEDRLKAALEEARHTKK
jgi:hypothetical protein